MTRNVGKIDRIVRLGLGALLLLLAVFGMIGIWGYIGVILLATGFVSFCPMYRLIGLRTCQDC